PFACSRTLRRFLRAWTDRLTRGIAYPIPSSFLTDFTLDSSTGTALRKRRLRFGDFFSSRWLRIAGRRISLPVPVTLKRFLAALCLFVFGISFGHSRVLRRSHQHRHVASLEERLLFDLADLVAVIRQPHQLVPHTLWVRRLAAPEHDRHLDLRALVEEALDVALLGVVVVNPDLGPELDLLDVDL